MDVDHGQLVRRGLEDVAVVMGLHDLAAVGGRAPGRRDGRWLKRFAQMREDLPDRPRLRDKGNQPDVAAAGWAFERKLLPHPRLGVSPRQSDALPVFSRVTGYLYPAIGIATCFAVGLIASLALPGRRRDLTGLTVFTQPPPA